MPLSPSTRPPDLRPKQASRWSVWFFGFWFAAVALPSACLIANHLLALPAATPRALDAATRWRVTHVLGADCGCSASVAENLTARGPQSDLAERILFLEPDPALQSALQRAGFSVETREAEAFAREEGVRGAPWLLVHRPDGALAYSGGYSLRRPGPFAPSEDLAILQSLRVGDSVETRPALGCATAQEWRGRLDPLGLKYR